MGNNGSHQTGNITQQIQSASRPIDNQHWEPQQQQHQPQRNQHHQHHLRTSYQHKLVVPDRDAHQRLRLTGNGEILQAGGTISGRNQQQPPQHPQQPPQQQPQQQQHGISRSSSIPTVRHTPQSPQQHWQANNARSTRQEQMKRFESEPDLRRAPQTHGNGKAIVHKDQQFSNNDRYKARKKYKAPPPPATGALVATTAGCTPAIVESITSSDGGGGNNAAALACSPMRARRARLFKTHAETKKQISSPINNHRKSMNSMCNNDLITPNMNSPPLLHYLHKSNQFHRSSDALHCFEESRKPSKSSKPTSAGIRSNQSSGAPIAPMQRTHSSPEFHAELMEATKRLDHNSKLKTLDHHLNIKDLVRNKLRLTKTSLAKPSSSTSSSSKQVLVRTSACGKESTPEQSPPKTFYFGMENELITTQRQTPNSINSDISSEHEVEISSHDIHIKLRPLLPKKQFEIPRFSPSIAWKLLSSLDLVRPLDGSTAGEVSEDGSSLEERRIEKARPRQLQLQLPPLPALPAYRQAPRSSHEKSGDSGISGDETPEVLAAIPRHKCTSWTPQQDLGDESSLESSSGGSIRDIPSNSRFSSRPHVFSLSLPRENHVSNNYVTDKCVLKPYSSLQKTKRSNGIFNSLVSSKQIGEVKDLDANNLDPAENWFLSQSAPNSLNNGINSLDLCLKYYTNNNNNNNHKNNKTTTTKETNNRRIMYLPQSNLKAILRKNQLSKSYDNISIKSSINAEPQPESLQDPAKSEQKKWTRKPKKFTFQSTVRQIERKRLADRLSREAERKEKQRLRELEAMQRVEEEFQKKRAGEKATIRQQLRLYSLEDDRAAVAAAERDSSHEEVRYEPDGAPSSLSHDNALKRVCVELNDDNNNSNNKSVTQSTQVLSEFRQQHREYKEFRSGGGRSAEHSHPRITCNIPIAATAQGGTVAAYTDNYRKDFVHGLKSADSSDSESMLDQTRIRPQHITRR